MFSARQYLGPILDNIRSLRGCPKGLGTTRALDWVLYIQTTSLGLSTKSIYYVLRIEPVANILRCHNASIVFSRPIQQLSDEFLDDMQTWSSKCMDCVDWTGGGSHLGRWLYMLNFSSPKPLETLKRTRADSTVFGYISSPIISTWAQYYLSARQKFGAIFFKCGDSR